MNVLSHESERSCVFMLGVSSLPLSTTLIFDFGVVLTVWYIFIFHLIKSSYCEFYKILFSTSNAINTVSYCVRYIVIQLCSFYNGDIKNIIMNVTNIFYIHL